MIVSWIAGRLMTTAGPYILAAAGVLYAGTLGFAGYHWIQAERTQATLAHAKAGWAKERQGLAERAADAQAKVRRAEQTKAQAVADIDKQLQDANREADAKNSVIADLRSGVVRLRARFAPRECPASVPGTAADTSVDQPAAASGLRGEDAQFLIRSARRCDANSRQLSAAQALLNEDRK